MEKVYTKNAPEAIGPYSQAMIAGDYVFTSGQLGITENGKLGDGIVEQTKAAIENLSAVLKAAGSGLTKVVKTTCFIADIKDFALFNEIYAEYFTEKPARSLIEVAALPKGGLIEIEAIAQVSKKA